jgi:lysozyme
MSTLHGSVFLRLKKDEGFRSRPYRCSAGKLTIGYGTNIEDGISLDEAEFLLRNRANLALMDCARTFPWFAELDAIRQGVIVQMAYQMGVDGVRGFRKMLAAIDRGDFAAAADEMLESKWARHDSPARAARHAATMRTGSLR